MKYKVMAALLLASALTLDVSLPVQATSVITGQPAEDNPLPLGGQITQFDPKSLAIVVGGSGYTLSPDVFIHSSSGKTLANDSLRPGVMVRFQASTPDLQHHQEITEILVNPER
ncbi:MAG: hypothetical protein ACYC9L_14360 [Sulfuricaulis sp.]